MRILTFLDYAILAFYLAGIFGAGLVLARRAGESIEHFFVGGRKMAWWLIGNSMAATNFGIGSVLLARPGRGAAPFGLAALALVARARDLTASGRSER